MLRFGAGCRYNSVRAMAAKLSADPSLRGRIKKGLTVQGILSEKQDAQIKSTITAEVIVDPRGCVAEPMVVPWSCPRCGRMYVQVQTSNGEEARAIGDLHSPEEQIRETYTDSASAAESIWQAEKYYGRAEDL